MSLILDALRKMEQERKARQGGVDIRPEVLGSRSGESRSPSRKTFTLVAAGIVILAAGIGAGIALKGGGPESAPEQALTRQRSEPLPREIPPAPVPVPSPALPSPKVEPTAPVVTRQAPREPRPAPTASPAPKPVQRPVVEEQPANGGYPDANLTVSGIAWQEERGLRRAVVNGSLVGEGAEIAGARVVEIGERRVKFSQGGRTISVSLSSPFQGR